MKQHTDHPFSLFGPTGLIPYDPDWRNAPVFSEFEPASLRDRPLTEAEKAALVACETAIEFIVGKPGGGKSMTATKLLIEELTKGKRMIVTNLALNLSRLQEYAHELGFTCNVLNRVRILTHEEVFHFYCYRGHHTVIKEPETPDDLFDFSQSQESPESAAGVFYVIDEVHNYFSTDRKVDASSPVFKWASQHRKLKDLCYLVTQSIENVHAKIRRLGQQFNYIRNLRKETFRGFRRGDGFMRTVYLQIPTSESAVCIHQEEMKLDTKGLASCYFTAGGVGVKAFGVADGGHQKKGMSMKWLWVALVVLVLGGVTLIFAIPYMAARAGGALVKSDKSVAPQPNQTPQPSPPATTPRPVSVASPPSAPAPPTLQPYPTGYILGRGLVNVTMSDGTTRTETDKELTRVERNSIVLGREKLFFRPAPRGKPREPSAPPPQRGEWRGYQEPPSTTGERQSPL